MRENITLCDCVIVATDPVHLFCCLVGASTLQKATWLQIDLLAQHAKALKVCAKVNDLTNLSSRTSALAQSLGQIFLLLLFFFFAFTFALILTRHRFYIFCILARHFWAFKGYVQKTSILTIRLLVQIMDSKIVDSTNSFEQTIFFFGVWKFVICLWVIWHLIIF